MAVTATVFSEADSNAHTRSAQDREAGVAQQHTGFRNHVPGGNDFAAIEQGSEGVTGS